MFVIFIIYLIEFNITLLILLYLLLLFLIVLFFLIK